MDVANKKVVWIRRGSLQRVFVEVDERGVDAIWSRGLSSDVTSSDIFLVDQKEKEMCKCVCVVCVCVWFVCACARVFV